MNQANQPADTADREIVTTRLIDAPRELVFAAWTDPQQIDKWWGPTGFSNATHSMDVRSGGTWDFIMHGPDGVDFPNFIRYIEVLKPERLVYDHGAKADEPAHFHVTVTFAAQGDKTFLTMRAVFPTAAARDHVVREFKAIEGGRQTIDRLEAHLKTL